MIDFIIFLFCCLFYLSWLLLCLLLSLIGILLPQKSKPISVDYLLNQDTICRILNSKGLLTDEEYNFEHQVVAPYYNDITFSGYLFIVKPFVYELKKSNRFDKIFQFLVHNWISAHKKKNNEKVEVSFFIIIVVKISTQIAYSSGKTIRFFNLN
jgi:hypothetical protein